MFIPLSYVEGLAVTDLLFPVVVLWIIGNSFLRYILSEEYVGNTAQPPEVILDMQWSITEYTIKVKKQNKAKTTKGLEAVMQHPELVCAVRQDTTVLSSQRI